MIYHKKIQNDDFRRKSSSADSKDHVSESGFLNNRAKPSVYHAVIVIFLEFFAWGLLTAPMLNCLQVKMLYIRAENSLQCFSEILQIPVTNSRRT